ncbi:hypothetical protein DFH08DRAFT_722000 [Mycena albidolilacea]|uniref:Uncharacterized protein n=1 Tax=Mycena albidolilacea TaxID=1033008 RepID=A0AAD6Z2F7_9AGAR|nr:hypothetical protein DFH08DRAFT_722000 [Mycena albidolilacea]
MASRAADNLRTYFRKAELPEMRRYPNAPDMPPSAQCSHHVSFQVEPKQARQMLEIRSLEAVPTMSCYQMGGEQLPKQSIAVEDVDMESGERFTVPCDPTFDIPPHVGQRPTDIMRIPRIDNLPLMTVQRTLYLLFFQDTANWSFSLVDTGRKVFQYFLWSFSGSGKPTMYGAALVPVPRDLLIVLFQPPWVLSEQDIHEFWRFNSSLSFPHFSATSGPVHVAALQSRERLWGKIWNIYAINKTRWSVLTSYDRWVFGIFSEGLGLGFTLLLKRRIRASAFPADARGPTILEFLVFWVACAMRLPGGCRIPNVGFPVG